MKVYIVLYEAGNYETVVSIEGVFSDEKKAQEYIDRQGGQSVVNRYDIKEWEVT